MGERGASGVCEGMKFIITFISFEYILIELKNILGKMGRSSVYFSHQSLIV
jgi:hypothetical protein